MVAAAASMSATQMGNSQKGGTQATMMGASTSSNATQMRRARSTGTLAKSGQMRLGKAAEDDEPPSYLAVHALSHPRRRLSASTGNLHGFMAEDYRTTRWPLPEMFGEEKYGHSLVNITDPTFLGEKRDTKKFAPGQSIQTSQWKKGQAKENLHNRKECADMSKQLIRLQYDQQIIDLTWRKAYKVLLDAEHKKKSLRPREGMGSNFITTTTTRLQKDVDNAEKRVRELQEQKDLYEREIQDVYDRCAEIKAQLKQEHFLEDMRRKQVEKTKDQIADDSAFWGNKFNIPRDKKNFVTATGTSYKTARD